MKRTSVRLALVALVAISIAIPVAADGREPSIGYGGAEIVRVKIKDAGRNRFAPRTVTVSEGTKIRWVNKGTLTHTTTGSEWNHRLDPGEKFTRKFRDAGTFTYRCTIHPSMRGTIVVT